MKVFLCNSSLTKQRYTATMCILKDFWLKLRFVVLVSIFKWFRSLNSSLLVFYMDETVSSSFHYLLTDHIQSTTTRNGSEGKSGIFNQESWVPYLRVCVMCFIKLVAAVLKLVLYILVEKYSTVNFSPYTQKYKSCVLVLKPNCALYKHLQCTTKHLLEVKKKIVFNLYKKIQINSDRGLKKSKQMQANCVIKYNG